MEYPKFISAYGLLNFMYKTYESPYSGYAEFKGKHLEFTGSNWSDRALDIVFIVSPLHERTVFLITKSTDADGNIRIGIIREFGELDELPTVIAPHELIDVILRSLYLR